MAIFGLKYWAELRSKYKSVLWRVEISERGYAGSVEEMTFDGSTPLRITWEKRGDEFHVPVKASEATIDILCRENFHYLSLFTSDPRQFRVSIFRNARLYWRGFVTADLYSENFTAPPYRVSIKAVDGFTLLSSIPFRDLLGVGITGPCSLWTLLSACMDLLELEVDGADWMDLYAEGMDENSSPLRQTFIDLERLYYVYEEPTYRDILELCLRPFAGQIFQSNGALHIRRTVSLYQTARPVSFYRIGTEHPVGRIVTGGGFRLVIHPGTQVVTSASRELMEGMWSGDLHVMGESVMDIVPALRKVEVGVENKSLSNLIDYLGFYDLDCWEKQRKFLSLSKADELCFGGNDDCRGEEVCTKGFPVAQCNYPLKLEYTIRTRRNEWGFGWIKPGDNHIVAVHYGVRIIGAKATWSLLDTGVWAQGDYEIVSEAKVGDEQNIKIERQGIPCDGDWVFFFRQTLIGKITSIGDGSRTSGHLESATFKNMTLTMDAEDIYDKGLRYESIIDPANNVDMSVQLPISDIPAVPNDHLLYALYFLDAQGKPTRLWHTKGRSDYDTLVGHIVQGALRYKQLPSRRLTGEIFTGLHVDMNTVVRDDKFLHAGFYVNSIELNAVEDSYNTELVEMLGLIRSERPPEGDDCFAVGIEKLQREYNALIILDCIEKIDMLFMKNQINTPDQRLRMVVQQSGHSVNGLAKELGLPRGENLYQILKGKNGISLDVAQRIHALYPEYSVEWLLCGDVDPLPYSCDKTVIRIPVFRDIWSKEFSPEKTPAENIVLSAEAANGAEFAVPYMDDILNPFLRNSLMLLRKHRDGEVLYGNIYLVIAERFRLFRIVHKDRRHPENLRLKTLLPAEYDDIIVRRDHIKAMCFVCGAICRMGV